jgi:hypothetical protein
VLIEERIYTLHPGVPTGDFLRPYETIGLVVARPILGGFLGYFVSEFGTMNQLVHWWSYVDLEDRRERRARLAADSEWQRCIGIVRPMIQTWESKILYPTSFSPIREMPVPLLDGAPVVTEAD